MTRPRSLWTADQVFGQAMASMLGAGMVLAAWVGASGTPRVDRQGAWLSLGVAGLVVAGASGAWFLLAGFRNVYTEVGDILAAGSPAVLGTVQAQGPASGGGQRVAAGDVVAVAGTARFHRPDCVLVAGKVVELATEVEHVRAGRHHCHICRP